MSAFVRFVRSKQTWKVVEAFSGKTFCLERLAYGKTYRVGAICEALGCSQRHLYSVFMRDIGLPPKDWLVLEKMVVARRKLEGGLSISRVARDMGYNSVVSFSRRFEKIHGVSPGRFMKSRNWFDPAGAPEDL